jgi:hypothetical protein
MRNRATFSAIQTDNTTGHRSNLKFSTNLQRNSHQSGNIKACLLVRIHQNGVFLPGIEQFCSFSGRKSALARPISGEPQI